MAKLAIYIEAVGLAVDEDGSPAAGSIAINLGEFKPGMEIPYAELVDGKDPVALLQAVIPCDVWGKLSDIRFITPEEYEREYGDDSD